MQRPNQRFLDVSAADHDRPPCCREPDDGDAVLRFRTGQVTILESDGAVAAWANVMRFRGGSECLDFDLSSLRCIRPTQGSTQAVAVADHDDEVDLEPGEWRVWIV